MYTNLDNLKDTAKHYGVQDIASYVLDNPQFAISIAGLTHHKYEGGLVDHTFEVVELAKKNAEQYFAYTGYPNDNRSQQLFLAALFHDFGKIWDHEFVHNLDGPGSWQYSNHQSKIHHIQRSAIEWTKACIKFNYVDENDEVLHAILAHHSKERGSAVDPQTPLAFILYVSDMTSAMMGKMQVKYIGIQE